MKYSKVQLQQIVLTRRPLLSNNPKVLTNYLMFIHHLCLTSSMMIIACIFLMTTTIKGRGHDVARALSGFVCFPVPPIHPLTRYLFLCYSHFMHREYCVGKHCRAELRKSKIFSHSQSRKVSMSRS